VPTIGEIAAHAIEPMANQPSGVIAPCVMMVTGGLLGATDWARAGASAPVATAIASNAAFATFRIMPPSTSRTTGADSVHGYWSVTMPVRFTQYHEIGQKTLVRPRNSRIDQLATLGELMQDRVKLAQVISSEAAVAG
jgi:hypothetical protein